ncbi:cytoskeletal protein binding protein [Myotisia sp. PD_48]|nr:cytoskeletal protein binding protein [Myotisia sp. PD_48]
MGFTGIFTALYDYAPQGENELGITEGDLLYVLDKGSDDGWWKAKKKTTAVDTEEPVGLIPHNYVQEAQPIQKARSLYDYTRQTDEEVSFPENAELLVFDTSDPDWTLVNVDSDYGFAPSNYIELLGEEVPADDAPEQPPTLPQRHAEVEPEKSPTSYAPPSPPQGPAAALAGVIHGHKQATSVDNSEPSPPLPSRETQAVRPTLTPQSSGNDEGPAPALPRRPISQQDSIREQVAVPAEPPREPPRIRSPYHPPRVENTGVQPSPPYSRMSTLDDIHQRPSAVSPSGYHLYNISEMISIMGKRKKMPTTLGINVAAGTIFISPEKSEDGPHQEWSADKLSHYSIEGKHVFLDLIRPSKSVDFHAGAKDTAREIVAALGEIAGAYRAEGLREVIAAGTSGAKKKGVILYDFMAQGDDEVTVGVDDEVIILDDSRSEEWWMVRRLKNGKEGVVPSSYIELTGVMSVPEPSISGINAGLPSVEQNRLEEARLAKQAVRSSRGHDSNKAVEVGPGMKLPARSSSLLGRDDGNKRSQRHKRESRSAKTKPDPTKTRKWTDRSGTFTVVAEFVGLADGKMHLHKQNGIKIAVPVSKMSIEDLEFVERVTGESLDEDKPLSDIRRRSQLLQTNDRGKVGASVSKVPEYDWFDFFLEAGVGPHQCERYANSFSKDSMDESILPEITPEVLRTLGLREGDILRVMKYLDEKFERKGKGKNVSFADNEEQSPGGLFSGPKGALRNNTRKGRPAPAVQTSDIVDPKAFEPKDPSSKPAPTEGNSSPAQEKAGPDAFEDNAWEVKTPVKPAAADSKPPAFAPVPPPGQSQPTLTGAMADLALLKPLEPTKTSTAPPPPVAPAITLPPAQTQPQPQTQLPQRPGANPGFFSQLGPPQPGSEPVLQPSHTQPVTMQMTGFQQQGTQMPMPPRQRPQPPQSINQASLLPPPPQRPLSAPNVSDNNALGAAPLQMQRTGLPSTTPQVAPPGHSLTELNQQRFQQSQLLLQPHPTGFQMQPMGGQLAPQQTGIFPPQQPQQSFMHLPQQQFMGGQQQFPQPSSPQQQQNFQPLMPQVTGFAYPPQQPIQQQPGINSVPLPNLQMQRTGMNGFGATQNFNIPPPPIPTQPTPAPLQPQKTGPAPPVRFGVRQDAKKLTPQPTGMKANLAQATPSNPFGF